ncbi:hypothetical protein LCGC14_2303600 [marine sediment metagenome]|uniref:Glycosyltransferase subfamily 4-like N-terminal domain-containing protein n=1 Tax=marine sediment metagenome TaxID=412755 RepID=A0A0F9CMP3_9ZZZZ
MKKILYFGDGSSYHIRNILNSIVNDYEIWLLTTRNVSYYHYNINIILLPRLTGLFKYFNPFIWFICLLINLKMIKPDLFEVIFITVHSWIVSFTGYKYILTTFGQDIINDININFIYKYLGMRALKKATHIICLSKIQKNACLKFVPENKVNLIYLGVDTVFFL